MNSIAMYCLTHLESEFIADDHEDAPGPALGGAGGLRLRSYRRTVGGALRAVAGLPVAVPPEAVPADLTGSTTLVEERPRQVGQAELLPAGGVEVGGIEPAEERLLERGPLFVDGRVPGGVAASAFVMRRLAEDAFE